METASRRPMNLGTGVQGMAYMQEYRKSISEAEEMKAGVICHVGLET